MLQSSKSREVKVMIHLGACVLMERTELSFQLGKIVSCSVHFNYEKVV